MVIIVIGYIIGIIWGLYFKVNIVLLYILIAIMYKICKKQKKKFKLISFRRYFRYIKIFLNQNVIISIILGSIISNTVINIKKYKFEKMYAEEKLKVECIIISEKQKKEYKNRYVALNTRNRTKIYLETKKSVKLQYGDKILCEGEFSKGETQRNHGGFNYNMYLKSINIYGILQVETYKKISENNVNIITRNIHKIKQDLIENLEENLIGDEKEIVKGLILGDSSNIEEEIVRNFQIANISHILAISGMHTIYIMIFVEGLTKRIFGKRISKYCVIIGLIVYMSMIGFTGSVTRAGIMGILGCIVFLIYRKRDTLSSIAFSLLLILLNNPYAIIRSGFTIIIFWYNRYYFF